MACGIGICFSCVAKVRQPDGSWDWKRTCVEGPSFRRGEDRVVKQRAPACKQRRRDYLAFEALIACDKRDFVRAAALAWITLCAAALSSFFTSVRNSVWLFVELLGRDRFADFSQLRAKARLGRTIAGAADGVLPHAFLGTGCIGHG